MNYKIECLKIMPNLKCISGSSLNYQYRIGIGSGNQSASFYSQLKDTPAQAWKSCYEQLTKNKK